jgi:hypothetical protein
MDVTSCFQWRNVTLNNPEVTNSGVAFEMDISFEECFIVFHHVSKKYSLLQLRQRSIDSLCVLKWVKTPTHPYLPAAIVTRIPENLEFCCRSNYFLESPPPPSPPPHRANDAATQPPPPLRADDAAAVCQTPHFNVCIFMVCILFPNVPLIIYYFIAMVQQSPVSASPCNSVKVCCSSAPPMRSGFRGSGPRVASSRHRRRVIPPPGRNLISTISSFRGRGRQNRQERVNT